ncbi:hypothetical protein BSKO_06759 [Bryopsis sp. KO-2023]|nr:hypothetical protein BSKO_06759 [Bryopsis sp. KO-2023]
MCTYFRNLKIPWKKSHFVEWVGWVGFMKYMDLVGEGWMPNGLAGARTLLEILNMHKVSVAVCCTEEADMMACMKRLRMDHLVCDVVSSGDVQCCRADPEAYTYAVMVISKPPALCVVIGSCNPTIEAAHQVGMQCWGGRGAAALSTEHCRFGGGRTGRNIFRQFATAVQIGRRGGVSI